MEPQNDKKRDLVNVQQKIATLDQLLANYNQLYTTYLQEVESEVNKKQQRKYPYTVKNPNAFENTLTPAVPFPSNGTEDACFKSCMNDDKCTYALYSNSGCGIDCNPNKCLLYGANADGIVPVAEVGSTVPKCPVSSGETDAWCKAFNNPVINSIIPVLMLRTGGTNWRTLLSQMPKSTADAADAPMTVDLTTNVQTWWPDSQFSDVNYAPGNEISLQFRYFAEYWLNAYNLQSGSTPVFAGQGAIGTFAFAKLSPNSQCNWHDTNQCIFKDYTMNGDACSTQSNNNPAYSVSGLAGYDASGLTGWLQALYNRNYGSNPAKGEAANVYNYWNKCKSVPGYEFLKNLYFANKNPGQASDNNNDSGTSYVGTFGGRTMLWNSESPSTGGVAAGLQTAIALASNTASSKFKRNYSAFEKQVWSVTPNMNAMMGQIPPQVAQISVPSWKFLGLQDSATACQTAAMNDADHVYTTATYFNASYNNPTNGNNAFARTCYGNVAGAPSSTTVSMQDTNVQSMTPPYGYTKLGGKNGIVILKKMYQLNKQIMALTDDLKISNPTTTTTKPATQNIREGMTNAERRDQIAKDGIKLNEIITNDINLDADAIQSEQLLLHSRIKLCVGVVLGIFMGYLAYRFLTMNDDLPNAIQEKLGSEMPAMAAAATAVATAATTTSNAIDEGMSELSDVSRTISDSLSKPINAMNGNK